MNYSLQLLVLKEELLEQVMGRALLFLSTLLLIIRKKVNQS